MFFNGINMMYGPHQYSLHVIANPAMSNGYPYRSPEPPSIFPISPAPVRPILERGDGDRGIYGANGKFEGDFFNDTLVGRGLSSLGSGIGDLVGGAAGLAARGLAGIADFAGFHETANDLRSWGDEVAGTSLEDIALDRSARAAEAQAKAVEKERELEQAKEDLNTAIDVAAQTETEEHIDKVGELGERVDQLGEEAAEARAVADQAQGVARDAVADVAEADAETAAARSEATTSETTAETDNTSTTGESADNTGNNTSTDSGSGGDSDGDSGSDGGSDK